MNKLMIFKKLIAALVFLPLAVSASGQFRNGASYEDLYDGETVAALKSHVRELSAAHLEGRKAGSDGEKAAAEYVAEVLENYGVDVLSPAGGETFGIRTAAGDTLTSLFTVKYCKRTACRRRFKR